MSYGQQAKYASLYQDNYSLYPFFIYFLYNKYCFIKQFYVRKLNVWLMLYNIYNLYNKMELEQYEQSPNIQ